MTIFQAIILGIVQGITEFLPISSSGHLVIVPHLLDWEIPSDQAFVFNVLVQLGTLFAVLVYFWKDLLAISTSFLKALRNRSLFQEDRYALLGWHLIVATLPAVLIGWFIKSSVEAAFDNLVFTAIALLITGGMLVIAEKMGGNEQRLREMNWKDALWIGFFQMLALFPGISRSGSTITGGMLRDMNRPAAARFSFLMAVPIMIGAAALSFIDLIALPETTAFIPALSAGFLASAIVGYLSIHWLLKFLNQRPIYLFAGYVFLLGLFTLLLL